MCAFLLRFLIAACSLLFKAHQAAKNSLIATATASTEASARSGKIGRERIWPTTTSVRGRLAGGRCWTAG